MKQINNILIFNNSCKKIVKSKAYVDFITARRYRGLSIIHYQHSVFHRSELDIDVELQNIHRHTHMVLFKQPLDVIQITTLGKQLVRGSD